MHHRNRGRRHSPSPIIPGSDLFNDSPQGPSRRDGVPVIPTPDPHSPRRVQGRYGRSPAGEVPGLHPQHWEGYPPAAAAFFGTVPPAGAYLSPQHAAYAAHTAPRGYPQMYGGGPGGFPPGFAPGGGPPPPGHFPPHPMMGRHASAPYHPGPLPQHGMSPMHPAWGGPPAGSMPMMYTPLDMYGMPIGMGGMGGALRPNEDMPIDRWAVGNSYAPVLEPLHLTVLNITLEINPLLLPPPEDNESRPFLKYNTLFPVSTAHRSDDSSHRSWSKGRHSPATFPRVSTLLLVSHDFPWIIPVNASLAARGVTCYDVLNELHNAFKLRLGKGLWHRLSRARQREIGERYHRNRSTWAGAPGADLDSGIRRIDYLADRVVWDGLNPDPGQKEKIMAKMGIVGKGWKMNIPPDPMGMPAAPPPEPEQLCWPAVMMVRLDVTGISVEEGPRFVRGEPMSAARARGETIGVVTDMSTTDATTTSTEEEHFG